MIPDVLAVHAVGVAEAIGLSNEELLAIRRAALDHSQLPGRPGEVLGWVRSKLERAVLPADSVLESAFARVGEVVQPLE